MNSARGFISENPPLHSRDYVDSAKFLKREAKRRSICKLSTNAKFSIFSTMTLKIILIVLSAINYTESHGLNV